MIIAPGRDDPRVVLVPSSMLAWLCLEAAGPLTKEELTRRVRPLLRAVNLDADGGGSQLSFDDDDLLWGHEIVVQFDANDRPIDVSFSG